MNILFLHRDYPAQFKYLTLALANNPNYNLMFITQDQTLEINGVKKYVMKVPPRKPSKCHKYLNFYDEILGYALGAAEAANKIKEEGIKPDVIIGFAFWGLNMFLKDIFPDVPIISYCEWFYNMEGADVGFDGKTYSEDVWSEVRCKNSHLLVDMCASDVLLSPTRWQMQQFPKEFHHKFQVIHDGIDTNTCAPNPDAKFTIPDKNLELGINDEIITYGTRGMEPYRGFPQFMEAAEKLLKKRPKAHIIIAGADKNYYGPPLEKGTYKEYMLKKLNLDMSRIHFVGGLSFNDFVKMLQVSSVHVYSTFPYILSWSVLNAMATGCCVVASNTAPVREIIQDNYNGLLFDFYNVDQLVEKVEYALDNQDKMQMVRNNTRNFAVENYNVLNILNRQISLIHSVIQNSKGGV